MVFCSDCGKENSKNLYCNYCGSFLMKEEYKNISSFNDFKEIVNRKNLNLIKNYNLTTEDYELILENITNKGIIDFQNNINKSSRDFRREKILDKILILTLSFSKINYKSSGAELGSYAFNLINIDDRLDNANQVTTLIHELSHHLLAEIFEQIMMFLLETEKTDAIEAFVWYVLSTNKVFVLMNEYCAHTVEGRFTPHGYQNYGSFNNLLQEFNLEEDKEAVIFALVMGNTFSRDIINILEKFIDLDLREEIKLQFKKDYTEPPKYDEILLESKELFDCESKCRFINDLISTGIENALTGNFDEALNKFKEIYSIVNKVD